MSNGYLIVIGLRIRSDVKNANKYRQPNFGGLNKFCEKLKREWTALSNAFRNGFQERAFK
jgi:hypothetical protein